MMLSSNSTDSMPNEDEQVLELKRQKGMKTLIKKNIQTQKSTEDQTLQATQLKILHLLGSFGQFITVQESQHHGLSKDMKYLQYTVPFVDCKPEFYIGKFRYNVVLHTFNTF